MKRDDLRNKMESISKKVFSSGDLKKFYPDESNLNVAIKRLVDAGELRQLTKGLYTFKKGGYDIEELATQLYYPSYISFESALSRYGIINQGIYGVTLATTRHSKKIRIETSECEYSKIKQSLFFGFNLIGNTFIAEPEKALLDELYLIKSGKRLMSEPDWYTEGLDIKKTYKYAEKFPQGMKQHLDAIFKETYSTVG